MVTIERCTGKDGHLVYRAKVRRRGALPQTVTFTKLANTRTWAKVTEGAAIEDDTSRNRGQPRAHLTLVAGTAWALSSRRFDACSHR
jgi:hypothetical protein